MEMKHTPGPWYHHKHSIRKNGKTFPIANVSVQELPRHENQFIDDIEGEANARLMAASPDLLKALQKCSLVLSGEEMSKQSLINALEDARKAIYKALGEDISVTPSSIEGLKDK